GEQTCAGTRELEHHRGLMFAVDPAYHVSKTSPDQLERDVSDAHEWPDLARKQHLVAARWPHPDRARVQCLRQLRRRCVEREHAGAYYRSEPGFLGDRQARRTTEPL